MKILMIHHSGLIGGGSMSFVNLVRDLAEHYEVVSYIPDDPNDLLTYFKKLGLPTKKFSFRLGKITYYNGGNRVISPKFWYHVFNIIFQYNFWKRIIKIENPDLIIVNSIVLAWMGILFTDLKSVCFVRETMKNNPNTIVNKIIKYLLEKFTIVSFLSNYDKDQFDLTNAKSIVMPDYLNLNEYEDKIGKKKACEILKIDPMKFNILFVGGINKLKGIDILLKAICLLDSDEEVQLIVCGQDAGVIGNKNIFISLFKKIIHFKDIQFSKKIRQDVIKNELENVVFNIGVQSNMATVYSSSDILVFPMQEPHQSRPIFEIGAQYKTFIISDFKNIKEFVKEGRNGLTFIPSDANDLAKKIKILKEDRALRDKLGFNNYKLTSHSRSTENTIDILYSTIRLIESTIIED